MTTRDIPKLRTCPKRKGGCGRKNHPDTFCQRPWCENYDTLCLTCDCSKYRNHQNARETAAKMKAYEEQVA